MEAVKLAGLEPASVFAYFEKLCSIPHGSGNTKAISDYLVSFAREHGLRYVQDGLNNVILFAEGTPGYEDHPAVILQGHMDMVCEKDADCPIDMDTEGLDVTHDGQFVFAKGTTLGGDDGIAVAYALALLADKTVDHPPLEVVIPEHNHTITIPSHSHGISYGIYEGGTASSVSILVDGKALPADAISSGQADVAAYLSADDDGKIRRGVWHTIEIVPDKLTRIVGNLYMMMFIQHRGGGSY